MKKLLIGLLFLPFLGLSQDFTNAIEQSRIEAQGILEEYPGLSIAVGVKDEIVWTEGFGYADAESGSQVSEEHRFLYYSLSKSILGIAINQLVATGAIDLDESILTYDASLPAHYSDVTIRTLLNHTAGVRHYNKGEWLKISMDNCQSPESAIQTFINDPLTSEPGKTHQYSSFGYVLLSHLLEKVTNSSFDEYMRNEVFLPRVVNGIERTTTSELMDMQATRYQKWSAKKHNGKVALVDNSCKFGGGSFIGNASDLAMLHMKVLQEEKAKESSTLYTPLIPEVSSYAYGLGVNTSTQGVTYYVHTGSGRGGSTILLIYPEFDLTIVILGNIKADGIKNIVGNVGNNFIAAIQG